MNAGGGKIPIVSVGELYLLNAGGGEVAIVSVGLVGELYFSCECWWLKGCCCLSRRTLSYDASGEKVAIVLVGELYLLNAGGGKVAIVSVGELYLVNAGGGNVAIVSVGELYL